MSDGYPATKHGEEELEVIRAVLAPLEHFFVELSGWKIAPYRSFAWQLHRAYVDDEADYPGLLELGFEISYVQHDTNYFSAVEAFVHEVCHWLVATPGERRCDNLALNWSRWGTRREAEACALQELLFAAVEFDISKHPTQGEQPGVLIDEDDRPRDIVACAARAKVDDHTFEALAHALRVSLVLATTAMEDEKQQREEVLHDRLRTKAHAQTLIEDHARKQKAANS